MNRNLLRGVAAVALALAGFTAVAQTPLPPYGAPITLEAAKKAMTAAETEARKNNWPVVIAIVDSGGHLVMLQRLEAQNASIDIAIGKASTAVNFRRPTKALEDSLAAGGTSVRILAVKGAYPLQGGLPIVVDGRIVGGNGVSGVLATQDRWSPRRGWTRWRPSRPGQGRGLGARQQLLLELLDPVAVALEDDVVVVDHGVEDRVGEVVRPAAAAVPLVEAQPLAHRLRVGLRRLVEGEDPGGSEDEAHLLGVDLLGPLLDAEGS